MKITTTEFKNLTKEKRTEFLNNHNAIVKFKLWFGNDKIINCIKDNLIIFTDDENQFITIYEKKESVKND